MILVGYLFLLLFVLFNNCIYIALLDYLLAIPYDILPPVANVIYFVATGGKRGYSKGELSDNSSQTPCNSGLVVRINKV